jgi:PPK2 family polyphosphate:nucleotide phosphotransferase
MTDRTEAEHLRRALAATPGEPFVIADSPTRDESFFPSKDDAKASCAADAAAIDDLQDRLHAEGARALLVVLQGMDTAGKGGTIKSVFAETSPMGMNVTAFKAPNTEELAHDYLWRIHKAVPRKGHIGIFDRSHYGDVLAVKVLGLQPPDEVEARYEDINAFERYLCRTGTKVVKFFLHISKEEQKERLQARLDKPHKRWKFSKADLDSRKLWDDYQEAYELMVNRCSTEHAPWYVIPSDSKSRRNAMVAQIVRQTLEDMNPQPPVVGWRPDDWLIK